MNVEHKAFDFELKREPTEDGVFEGYASVFNIVDQGNDVVNKGAFENSLGEGRKVKMLWNHDPDQPIGVWDEIKEDERGLFVKGRILKDVQKGADTIALLKGGAIDSMSIGYQTIEATKEGSENSNIRRLMKVNLWEISVVTFPMLPAATVTDIKSITTIREFEKSLRDAGYSQVEAKAIAAQGFKGLLTHRDDAAGGLSPEGIQIKDDLLSQIAHMKGKLNV